MPITQLSPHPAGPDASTRTAFLVVDTESVPDGDLLAKVKYRRGKPSPGGRGRPHQEEARQASQHRVRFHRRSRSKCRSAVCVVRVGGRFQLQAITCLDAPQFRAREIVRKFWLGVGMYKAKLVTFNGRGFDMPMLELAAFRYGFGLRDYFQNSRNRYPGQSHRPARLDGELRRLPAGGRAEPAGQDARQAGQDGNCRRPGLRHAPGGPAPGDQRLLHVRHAGHLFRVPANAGADRGYSRWIRSRSWCGRAQEFLQSKIERVAGTGAVSGELGKG